MTPLRLPNTIMDTSKAVHHINVPVEKGVIQQDFPWKLELKR